MMGEEVDEASKQLEEALYLQALVHLGTCTTLRSAGGTTRRSQAIHKFDTVHWWQIPNTGVLYFLQAYQQQKKDYRKCDTSANGAGDLCDKGHGKGQSIRCFFCLSKTCFQEFQTSRKVWSKQELTSVMEDQSREHLNKLIIYKSTGSGGMHPRAGQCHCDTTINYHWKAVVTEDWKKV